MIFIYDVLVNMNEDLIDFYDWEETDTYEHIRRGCLIKIYSEDYYNLLTKTFKIDLELMNQIKDKTQKFSGRNTLIVDYQLAFTDGINAFMVKFDKNGVSKLKSKFLVNEEVEILAISTNMKITKVNYEILKDEKRQNRMTRKEKRIVNLITSELNILKNDKDKIDYLYYEWFDTNIGNDKFNTLINSINNEYTTKHKEFLNILNLITMKK